MEPDEFGRTVEFRDDGDPDHVTMIETLDLTHPRCPVIYFKRGTWPPEPVPGAVELTRTIPVPRIAVADGHL